MPKRGPKPLPDDQRRKSVAKSCYRGDEFEEVERAAGRVRKPLAVLQRIATLNLARRINQGVPRNPCGG